MFEESIEHRYRYNATFRNLVDILRCELKRYNTTTAELREAAMLAATMHESERVRPLLIWKTQDWGYPLMFGGAVTGRFDSTKPNPGNVPQPKENRSPHAPADRRWRKTDSLYRSRARVDKFERNQGGYKKKGFDEKTGDRRKAKPKTHCHVFVGTGKGYSLCTCGLSDTYYYHMHVTKKP